MQNYAIVILCNNDACYKILVTVYVNGYGKSWVKHIKERLMNGRVTLKDIASTMEISRTSVHRALHGKEGVNEELRVKIRAKAEEMGYVVNYAATSLKRKTVSLAVVLPDRQGVGRLYNKYVWDAVETFIPEANSLNTHIEFYSYCEESDEQVNILNDILNGKNQVNGLLTMVSKSNDSMHRVVERFGDRNIPVVLIDNDLPGTGRFCCIAPHDEQIGRLGAELLISITPNDGKILVAGGSLERASHGLSLEGFIEYIAKSGRKLETIVINSFSNSGLCYDKAKKVIEEHKDIVAFYAVTARDTLPLCKAVYDSGLAGKIIGIGSDLNPESAKLLKEGTINALVYKNAFEKGSLGFRVLFDLVVKNINHKRDNMTVPISIIMKNNLPFFEDFIKTK